MRIRLHNTRHLGMLFNAPEGEGGGGDAAAQAAADAAAKTATDAAAKATADAAAKTAADAATAAAQDVKSLPDWAQKVIADARKDAGDARTNAKQTAADEAKAEVAQIIGKALGLVKGDPLTAEELAKEVVTAKDTARSAQVELAVYKASGTHQANPVALLDSRTFLAKVAELDPSKTGFDAKVADAIKDAVKDHPELKATLAAARSSVSHAGGTGEGTKQSDDPQQRARDYYESTK
jgi:hypothetical protein